MPELMNQNQPEHKRISQKAKNSENVTQVAGNYTKTINIWLFIIGIFALGGLAWAFVVGLNEGGQNPKTEQEKPTVTTPGKTKSSPAPTNSSKP